MYSPTGDVIAVILGKGLLRMYNTFSQMELRTIQSNSKRIGSLGFSPYSDVLALGTFHDEIQVWNYGNGTVIHTLKNHKGPVSGIHFSNNGTMIASASHDTSIKIWPAHIAPGTDKSIIDAVLSLMKDAGFSVKKDEISITISR
jgi:WD40 repeat protein